MNHHFSQHQFQLSRVQFPPCRTAWAATACGLVALGLAGCALKGHGSTPTSGGGPKPPPVISPLTNGVATANQVEVTAKGKNGVAWILKTPQVGASLGQQTVEIMSVDGTLFQENKPSLHLKAAHAQVNWKDHVLVLDQGVQAESLLHPASFRGDQLTWHWDEQNGLEITGHVHFQWGATAVEAGRMIGDVDLRTARLLDNPTATSPISG